jgi:hypothetical protein
MNQIRRMMRSRSRRWWAFAVPAAIVMAVTAPGTAAQAASLQERQVTGNVVFDMMDYEPFGANERCRYDIPIVNRGQVLGPPVRYWYFGKCGGEIRTEIHYRIQRNSNGVLVVDDISVPFFEGTTAETNDQDGGTVIARYEIPPGQTVTKQVRVQNDSEGEPDDRTIVTFTLRN